MEFLSVVLLWWRSMWIRQFPRVWKQSLFFNFSMTYVGAGMICSHLVNFSLLLGVAVSWGIMWPLIIERKGDWFPATLSESSMKSVNGYKAVAQVGALIMLQPEVGGSRQNSFFAGIVKVRFRKPVIAGDTLVMRMTLTKLQKRFGIAKMEGKRAVGRMPKDNDTCRLSRAVAYASALGDT